MTATTNARRLGPLAVLALLAGPLLSMVDSNVVNVAIPVITRDLHGNLADVQWSVSGYLLALAATLPASAWLAKRWGSVRVYAVSLAGFTLASVACAAAGTVAQLVAARAVQGVAAAPLVPLAMNLLFGGARAGSPGAPAGSLPTPGGRELPVAAGIALFLGPALGPTLGGLLIAAWSWPVIFLINAPIGLAALMALPTLRRHGIVSERDDDARLDPVGLVLLSAGMVATLYGASRGPNHGWWNETVWPYWSGGLVILALYVVWAPRRRQPAVDLRLLRSGQSALAIWLCLLTSVALFSVLFLLPLVVQDVQGHGPLASGLVLLPQGIVMGLSTWLGQRLGERGWLRLSILTGLIAVAATTALLLRVDVGTPLWALAVILAGRGLGLGLVIQPLLLALLAGLRPGQVADANTLFNVGQRLGGSVGVSLLATFFASRVASHITAVVGPVAAGAGSPGGLASAPPALRPRLADAALAGFHDTIWIAVMVAVVGLVFALALRRPDGVRRRDRPRSGSIPAAERDRVETPHAGP